MHVVAALWVVAVVAAVLLVLGPGHLWGKAGTSPVATYIGNVNLLDQEMSAPLGRLVTAYRSFSKPKAQGPKEQARLAQAERTLRSFEARLTALPAPPEASKLRRLLLQLMRDEDRVAVEIVELAQFAPRFDALIAVAGAANAKLAKQLAAEKLPKAHVVRGTAKHVAAAQAAYDAAARRVQDDQADAVDAYDGALAAALLSLRKLTPPPVFGPAYRTEIRTLEATTTAGAALSRELRKGGSKRTALLGRRFTNASRLSGSVAAQRAEIAAVKAYNKRVRSIGRAQSAIQSEIARLQR